MPCELIWEHKGVYKRLSGFVTGDEFLRSVEAIQADPRFDEIRYVINDFSAVSGHELDEDLLTELAAIQYGGRASNPQVRAVYVGTDALLTQRLQSVLIDSQRSVYEVTLFSTTAQAREWLQAQLAQPWRGRFAQHRS